MSILPQVQKSQSSNWSAWFFVQGQECSSRDIEKQADPANRSSRMEVLLVRSVEKALDAVNGRLRSMTWNAVLSKDDGLKVLQVWSRQHPLFLAKICPRDLT